MNDFDHIDGGTGSDILHGGELGDYIYGGSNFTPAGQYQTHDWLYGDDGEDLLFGEGGRDVVSGGGGGDLCDGGAGMAGNSPEDDIASSDCDVVVNTP